MSHQPQTIEQFIDLRCNGKCLMDISDELRVPLSTLGDWNKRCAERIRHERAVKWECCEQGATLNIEKDLIRLAHRILLCEKELGRRPLSAMSTSELLRVLSSSRREYFRRRNPHLAPLEAPSLPPTPTLTPNLNLNPNLNPTPNPQSAVPKTKPEKTGNISGFPDLPVAPQRLTTNGNHISDFRNGRAAHLLPADLLKNVRCNPTPNA